MLSLGKHKNTGKTKERNEPRRNREEEPGEMEKTSSGDEKNITLLSKIVQSYHPIITLRCVITDQAHYTYLCMALP